VRLRRVRSLLKPYLTEELYTERLLEADRADPASASLYGPDLSREVLRSSAAAAAIASREAFDVIHAHDWLTFAGAATSRSRKPSFSTCTHRIRPLRQQDSGFVVGVERQA
jgi:hypothetical protein